MKKLFYLFIAIIITGCSNNELDRDEARSILEETIGYPYVQYANFSWQSYNGLNKQEFAMYVPAKRKDVNIKSLIDKGLFDYRIGDRKVYGVTGSYRRTDRVQLFELSETGKEFLSSGQDYKPAKSYTKATLPVHLIQISEVTGLKFENESKTKATVEFIEEIKESSPFNIISPELRNSNSRKLIVGFELYDDGWRLTNWNLGKITRKKLSNVPNWDKLLALDIVEKTEQEMINENQGGPEDLIGVINDPDGYSNLRKGKSSSSEILRRVNKDVQFLIMSTQGTWWNVNILDGQGGQGYIHNSRIKILENTAVKNPNSDYPIDNAIKDKIIDVKVTNLSVRDKPSLNANKIDVMNPGDAYPLTGKKSNKRTEVEIRGKKINEYWYEIYLESGGTGWIHGCCFKVK